MGFKSYKSLGCQSFQNAGSRISAFGEVQPLPQPTINTFLSSGTFTLTSTKTVNYLIVAGGGGGGAPDTIAGGGGAGGYMKGSITLDANSYQVVVGRGGLGGIRDNRNEDGSRIGGNSSAFGIISYGGGGGGTGYLPPNNGGSGGGGSADAGRQGANGTLGQGFGGGVGYNSGLRNNPINAGGGGGATSAGGNSNSSGAGNGGAGILIDSSNFEFYDQSNYFCGGGGGAKQTSGTPGLGGIGVGGRGTDQGANQQGQNGTINTGGGGGGSTDAYAGSFSGGSGIVILTYSN